MSVGCSAWSRTLGFPATGRRGYAWERKMSTQARLELIWLPQNASARAEPRLRFQLSDPPATAHVEGAPVEFILSVCGGPRCGCTSIRLTAPPAADDVEPKTRVFPPEIWLDLETKSLVRGSDSTGYPVFDRLDGIVRTQLTDADRQELREWFFAEKLELIHTAPLDQIDIEGLPDASSGEMIGFIDVFPCGLAFNFTFEGERWAVDDQYCVQPKCSCSETILSFLQLADRSGVPAKKISDPPSFRYNYITHRTKPLSESPTTGPSQTDLFGALKAVNPKLDEHLQLRHLSLQTLYTRQEIERSKSRLRSLSASLRPKIGRNDPCPCGSGRKFKHCCLNKANPAPEGPGGASK